MLKGIWYPVELELLTNLLVDEELVWLAYSDESVRMGRYLNPPLCAGKGSPINHFTSLERHSGRKERITHWMKLLKPEHPSSKF